MFAGELHRIRPPQALPELALHHYRLPVSTTCSPSSYSSISSAVELCPCRVAPRTNALPRSRPPLLASAPSRSHRPPAMASPSSAPPSPCSPFAVAGVAPADSHCYCCYLRSASRPPAALLAVAAKCSSTARRCLLPSPPWAADAAAALLSLPLMPPLPVLLACYAAVVTAARVRVLEQQQRLPPLAPPDAAPLRRWPSAFPCARPRSRLGHPRRRALAAYVGRSLGSRCWCTASPTPRHCKCSA